MTTDLNFPQSWAIMPLGQIAQVVYGKALPAIQRISEGKYPVYGSGGIIGRHDHFLHKQPSIIIGRKGSVGTVYYESQPFWCIDTAFYLDNISPYVYPEYLALALKFLDLSKFTVVVAIPGLSRNELERINIPLPTLREQRRIVVILQKLEAIKDLQQSRVSDIKQILSKVFIDMFGDPIYNSNNWKTESLEDLGKIDRGKSRYRPRNAEHLYGGPYPFIQTGDITKSDGWITKYTQTYSEAGLLQSRLWEPNTVCITIAANIAHTAILTFPACFPDSIVGFISSPHVTPEYICQCLSLMQTYLEKIAPQGAQKNINLSILNQLKIPLPPIEMQKKFSEIALAYRTLLISIENLNNELNKLNTLLLSQGLFGFLTAIWRDHHFHELEEEEVERNDWIESIRHNRDNSESNSNLDTKLPIAFQHRKSLWLNLGEKQKKIYELIMAEGGYFTAQSLLKSTDMSITEIEQTLNLLADLGVIRSTALLHELMGRGNVLIPVYRLEDNKG